MEPIDIGLWVTGGMLVMVVLGMRVGFAAGLAGFVGLVWLRCSCWRRCPLRLVSSPFSHRPSARLSNDHVGWGLARGLGGLGAVCRPDPCQPDPFRDSGADKTGDMVCFLRRPPALDGNPDDAEDQGACDDNSSPSGPRNTVVGVHAQLRRPRCKSREVPSRDAAVRMGPARHSWVDRCSPWPGCNR